MGRNPGAIKCSTTHKMGKIKTRGRCNSRKGTLFSCCCEVILWFAVACLLNGVCSATCLSETGNSTRANCSSVEGSVENSTDISLGRTASTMKTGLGSTEIQGVTDSREATTNGNGSSFIMSALTGDESNNEEIERTGQGGNSLEGQVVRNYKTDTRTLPPNSQTTENDEEGFSKDKILAIIIPAICVFLFAITFIVVYKLCNKYKCCKNNKCLQKCSLFCDACISGPYQYQMTRSQQLQTGSQTLSLNPEFRSTSMHRSINSRNSHMSSASAGRARHLSGTSRSSRTTHASRSSRSIPSRSRHTSSRSQDRVSFVSGRNPSHYSSQGSNLSQSSRDEARVPLKSPKS